ncbi:MAG: HAD family hydrolase [Myxococcota bacterium]
MASRDPVPHTYEALTRDYDAYIFDCDGTLADSMPLHFEAWRRALSNHEAPFEFEWDLFVSRAGKTLEVTVHELNQQFESRLDVMAVARLQREIYAELLPSVGPIVEVVTLVRELWGRYPLAVASGGDRRTVETTLMNLGILDAFHTIVTAEDVAHGKPAPDMFLLAAERMGVAPERCVVFEDSLLGIEGAQRANMGYSLVKRVSAEGRTGMG